MMTLIKDLWSKRRFRLAATLGILNLVLLVVVVVGARHVLNPGEVNALVPLPALKTASGVVQPRFLFSINGVSRPLGVAVSPSGDRIYVSESDDQRETKVFDRGGHLVGSLNPPDSEPTSRVPIYLAVDPGGKVYVSDRQARTVYIYSSQGKYVGQIAATELAEDGWMPLALSFDAQGNLLTSNTTPGKHGVEIFDAEGKLLQRFGREGSGSDEFKYPNGIARDTLGRIVVTDSNNGRVKVLDSRGELLWSFGRGSGGVALGLPRGVAIDDRNRAYVVDTINHNVLVFELGEQGPKLLYTFGTQGMGDGEFNFPNGLALDKGGRIYITDRENDRVQVWTF